MPGGRGLRRRTCCERRGEGSVGGALAHRAPLVSANERPVLAADLAGAVAAAGVDPTLEGRALQDALRPAIATRRGYCSWTVDQLSWVVTLHSPEEQDFYGKILTEALSRLLVWFMSVSGRRGAVPAL